jgi:hypothetical protein
MHPRREWILVSSMSLAIAIGAGTAVVACATGVATFLDTADDGGAAPSDASSEGRVELSGFGGIDGGSEGPSITEESFSCDGCAPFPPHGARVCDKSALGTPTLVYPPDGVLLPPNMNVLEVQWVPPSGAHLFEVDFTNAVTDVRVETPCDALTTVRGSREVGCGLTLTHEQWKDIANANRDGDPVEVSVRAAPAGGACVTSSPERASIAFARDDLTGGIYYWQSATFGGTAGRTGGIYYHDFGTSDPVPKPFYTSGSTGTCVGCHTLSPDGERMALGIDDPDADDEYGDVEARTMDVASRTVVGGHKVSPGFQTFTHDHALMIASTFKTSEKNMAFAVWDGDGTKKLGTAPLPKVGGVQLEGTQPNLSWDDRTLVFVVPGRTHAGASTISKAGDHHFLGSSLWSASFDANARTLEHVQPLLTPDGSQTYYYPDQSVDGHWVVFDENDDASAANNDGDCFYSRKARVKLMHVPPRPGDAPLDLARLNVEGALSNSWPRWSPAPTSYKGKRVLWVTFSSNRDYGLRLKNTVAGYPQGAPGFDNYYPPASPAYDQPQPTNRSGVTFDAYASPQIWMAAVVVDPSRALDHEDRSYPAFWLPFQDVTAHNHSAQWVVKVASPGAPDAGACGRLNDPCGAGGATCCPDVVCCPGSHATCQVTCTR